MLNRHYHETVKKIITESSCEYSNQASSVQLEFHFKRFDLLLEEKKLFLFSVLV